MIVDVRSYERIEFYHDLTGHEGVLYPNPNFGEGNFTFYYLDADPRWYMNITFEDANNKFNSPEREFDRWVFVKGEKYQDRQNKG